MREGDTPVLVLTLEQKEALVCAALTLGVLVGAAWCWWYLAGCYLVLLCYRGFAAVYLREDIGNHVVVVTAAATPTGRALAHAFAKRGCRLALWDSSPQVREVEAEVQRVPQCPCVISYVVDATHRDMVYDTAEHVERDLGGVDILVCASAPQHTAGRAAGRAAGAVSPSRRSGRRLAAETADLTAEAGLRAGVLSTVWAVRSFLTPMLERNRGCVVVVSASPQGGGAEAAEAAATQAAAHAYGESLRREMSSGRRPVRVLTAVVPTPPAEERSASPARRGCPAVCERAADRVAAAVERRCRHVCVSRGIVPAATVDAAVRCLPVAAADALAPALHRLL